MRRFSLKSIIEITIERMLILTFVLLAGLIHAQQIPSEQIIEKARAYDDEGKYTEAINQFLLIHENDSNYTRMLSEVALTYLSMEKYDSALYYSNKGLALPGPNTISLYLTKGTALDEQGFTKEAIATFKYAIELYPNFHLIHHSYGMILMKNEQFEEAEECFKKALSCNSFHASSHLALGRLMARQKQYTKAFLALETFLALEPSSYRSNEILIYLENLSDNQFDTLQGSYIEPFSENKIFSETDHYIRAKIALSDRYPLKVDFNASIVKQTQMLLEVLPYDADTNNFWVRLYLPLFKAIRDGGYLEPFIYTLLQSTKLEKVSTYLEKNEKLLSEFYSTGGELSQFYALRLLNLEGKPEYYSCVFYDSGSLNSIGNMNKNGNKDGLWLYFHPNQELKVRGVFVDGKKDGLWKFWNESGLLTFSQEYKNGKLNGWEKGFYKNGNLKFQAPYTNGKIEGMVSWYDVYGIRAGESIFVNNTKQGTGKNFYASGKIKDSLSYENGEISGPYLSYYPDGKIKERAFYKNGVLDGDYIGYYDNGNISFLGNYNEGKLEGEWSKYYHNGILKSRDFYKDDLKVGTHTEYYPHGSINKSSQYNDKGELHGNVELFDLEGFLARRETYKNGIITSLASFDNEGEVFKSYGDSTGTFDFTNYGRNGNKINSGSYLEGKRDGNWTLYYYYGNVWKQYQYKDGLLDGEYKTFHLNGAPEIVSSYKSGERDGYYIKYHRSGNKIAEGFLKKGLQEGHWYYYYPDGSLDGYYYYEGGELSGWSISYAVDGQVKSRSQHHEGRLFQHIVFNKHGEVITEVDFAVHKKAIIKSAPDIVLAEYHVKNGLYDGGYLWYHPNGKVLSKKTFVNDKKKGLYQRFYDSGEIREQGNFNDDERAGKWSSWYENGSLKSTYYYFNGFMDSICLSYYENGVVFSKENFAFGELHGAVELFDPNGDLMIGMTYYNGQLVTYQYNKEGKLCPPIKIESPDQQIIAYYNNGQISYLQETKNYLAHGKTLLYANDGSFIKKMEYNNGILTGSYETYHLNGNLKIQTDYIAGLIDGEQKEYYESGKLKSSCNYKNGLEHGKKEFFDESGNLIRVENYWSGDFIGNGHLQQ